MPRKTLIDKLVRPPELIKGDLVYHILYGRDWVGVFLSSKEETQGLSTPRDIGLVCMQPGTKYEFFFKKYLKKYWVADNMGYVSIHWLRKLEGNLGPKKR